MKKSNLYNQDVVFSRPHKNMIGEIIVNEGARGVVISESGDCCYVFIPDLHRQVFCPKDILTVEIKPDFTGLLNDCENSAMWNLLEHWLGLSNPTDVVATPNVRYIHSAFDKIDRRLKEVS